MIKKVLLYLDLNSVLYKHHHDFRAKEEGEKRTKRFPLSGVYMYVLPAFIVAFVG